MAKSEFEDIGQILAKCYDPFMHIPGTVVRRGEVIRLAKKLKSLLSKRDFKPADAKKLVDRMQRVTMEQIRLNGAERKRPGKDLN